MSLLASAAMGKPSASRDESLSGVRKRLERVDWDFTDRVSNGDLEGIHPYPAKFVADLPRSVIQSVGLTAGARVFDPFSGSGTTLTEAQRHGLVAVGVDLNPIACLMSRVKTATAPPELEEAARKVFNAAIGLNATIPDIPRLDHWFEPAAQRALANLRHAVWKAPVAVRDHLKLALSSIIVKVSNQESDTRYAAIKKNITEYYVYESFYSAAVRIAMALRGRGYELSPAIVLEADTLSICADDIGGKVDLIITSPPYPNAYEYWLYHKYRMWWLGHDALDVKEKEIGARAHFFKKNHHTAEDFVGQMDKTFTLIDRVSNEDAIACFVVGRSKIHGEIVDNAAIICNSAAKSGFSQLFSTERTIKANRKSFNLSHANIKTESVLVFSKRAS